jgi:hypothetical protein
VEAAGSNPVIPTVLDILNDSMRSFFLYICSPHLRVVAQPGSALAWGARGRWFESSPPDNNWQFALPIFI